MSKRGFTVQMECSLRHRQRSVSPKNARKAQTTKTDSQWLESPAKLAHSWTSQAASAAHLMEL